MLFDYIALCILGPLVARLPLALTKMLVRAVRRRFGPRLTAVEEDALTRLYVDIDDGMYRNFSARVSRRMASVLDIVLGRTVLARIWNSTWLFTTIAFLVLFGHEYGLRHSFPATFHVVVVRFPVALAPYLIFGAALFSLHIALATGVLGRVDATMTLGRYVGVFAVLCGFAYLFAWAGAYIGAAGMFAMPALLNLHWKVAASLFSSGLSFEWRNALTAPWASTVKVDGLGLNLLTNLGLLPALGMAMVLLACLSVEAGLERQRSRVLRGVASLSNHALTVRVLKFLEHLLR